MSCAGWKTSHFAPNTATVIPSGDAVSARLRQDLAMLVSAGGRERTEAELRALLASAGFRLARVVPLGDADQFCVIEGVPA